MAATNAFWAKNPITGPKKQDPKAPGQGVYESKPQASVAQLQHSQQPVQAPSSTPSIATAPAIAARRPEPRKGAQPAHQDQHHGNHSRGMYLNRGSMNQQHQGQQKKPQIQSFDSLPADLQRISVRMAVVAPDKDKVYRWLIGRNGSNIKLMQSLVYQFKSIGSKDMSYLKVNACWSFE